MIKILPFILLVSCSTPMVSTVPKEARISTKKFSGPTEARNFVRNKLNYINILFEQSRDPYYGTPRWPEECLSQQEFGKLREEHGNTFFLSRLFLNERNEPGDCKGKLSDVLYLQCSGEAEVHEIICPLKMCQSVVNGNPCPLNK